MPEHKKYKTHLIRYISLIIYIIISHNIFAQIIDSDQAPSWIKWRQIQTGNFRLIYPEKFEKTATSLAKKIDTMITNSHQDLAIEPRKISIILQSHHVEQNGFAQLAPRKIEAFSTPGPASDNTGWLSNLILHELRHIAQFDKLTGQLKPPFFEQLALALYGIHLPAWYFEGDAVSIETQYSSGGRGRSSFWLLPLSTNLRAGNTYNLQKNTLGSFKDITPSYYATGYAMNTYLTNRFGYSIHERILENMRKNLWRPFNFDRALKTETGLRSTTLFQVTTDSLKAAWKSATASTNHFTPIVADNSHFWEHQYLPKRDSAGAVFFLRDNPQQLPAIMKTDGQHTSQVAQIGSQLRPYFHLNDRFIVWDELRKDARFGKQTYSIIRIKDLRTGRTRSLSKKSRLYSPVLSQDSKRVYVVQVDENNRSSLLYIDQKSKRTEKITDFPEQYQLLQPMLDDEESKIVAILIAPKGTNLVEIELKTGEWSSLLPWSNIEYQQPYYQGEDVIFQANLNDKGDVFRYQIARDSLIRLTDVEHGALHSSISDDSLLYFSNYTPEGYKVVKTSLRPENKQEVKAKLWASASVDRRAADTLFLEVKTDTTAIASHPYRPITGLFNFHSLSLSNNNFQSFDNYHPGIFWLANDLLQTSEVKIGYQYDLEMEKSIYSAALTYQRYYPKFHLSYQNRGQIGHAKQQNTGGYTRYDFREHLYQLTMQIPLSIYRGAYIYNFGVNIGTSYQKRYNLSAPWLSGFYDEIAFPVNYQLYLGRTRRRSRMDLVPRWGQNISVIFRHTPLESGPSGRMIAIRTNLYFPGLISNHGFRARFSWQQSEGRYELSQDIPMVSGYAHFDSPRVQNTLLLNYYFPIAYPDWSIGSLAYIKRFHGYLFADYQNVQRSSLAPISFGVGLSADFNMFRYVLPDFGASVKLSYLNHPGTRKVVPSVSLSYNY